MRRRSVRGVLRHNAVACQRTGGATPNCLLLARALNKVPGKRGPPPRLELEQRLLIRPALAAGDPEPKAVRCPLGFERISAAN